MTFELKEITALHVPGLNTYDLKIEGTRPNTLENVRQINVIIGANSSGKSRFMRTIFSQVITEFDLGHKLTEKALEELCAKATSISNRYYNPLHALLSRNEEALFDSNLRRSTRQTIETEILKKNNSCGELDIDEVEDIWFSQELLNSMTNSSTSNNFNVSGKRKEYIPILRGLRTLVPNTDVYRERTLHDYFSFPSSEANLNIFTGHTLYDDMVYALLGIEEEQASVKAFQDYLSTHFFEGQRVNIIPRKVRNDKSSAKENNVVHIKIGDEPQRPIYELGDGIQAMIALTVRPFLEKEPTIFFIEEPEQNLHAGMQRALIDAFRACPQHMFFFTTQSNHFVDLTLESDDTNLISVKKEIDADGKANSIIQSQADNNEVLKELGVLASSVLLANCSIWVEGVTDKRYLQLYLEKFLTELEAFGNSEDGCQKEREIAKARVAKLRTFNENLHYVFVEYQGANITHWSFSAKLDSENNFKTPAPRLSKEIFLIADADIADKSDRVRKLEESLGDRFELLKWKEIENYIPKDITIKTAKKCWDKFQKTEGSNYDFDNLSDEYFQNKEIGIGGLLEDKVTRTNNAQKELGRYFFRDGAPTISVGGEDIPSPSSGSTIRIKVQFCETAVLIMKEESDGWNLTPELSELCNKIWKFVEDCN
ncbi:AAA family ATPase [Vibrio jasicida]|uniref:AAA family ATPase n=1 Tax=Vibrio jasicida TaxID=766224 RepID=UPI00039BF86C|nr:ATP-binding protein [Vibrio jasicida]